MDLQAEQIDEDHDRFSSPPINLKLEARRALKPSAPPWLVLMIFAVLLALGFALGYLTALALT